MAGRADSLVSISLRPVFEMLRVTDLVGRSIPVRRPGNFKALLAGTPTPEKFRAAHLYPIRGFAATRDGAWLALNFDSAVMPGDALAESKVFIVNFEQSEPRVYRQIKSAFSDNISVPTNVGEEFIGDRFLRSAFAGPADLKEYFERKQVYEFYDLVTREIFLFADHVAIPSILYTRAFSERYYLVAHVEGGCLKFSFVDFDVLKMTSRILMTFTDRILGTQLLFNVVDSPGRDVAQLSSDRIVIGCDVFKNKIWRRRLVTLRDGHVDIGLATEISDRLKGSLQPIVGDVRHLARISEHGRVEIVEPGKLPRIYETQNEDIFGPLERVDGGFLVCEANHPNYGCLFLLDGGAWRQVTASGLRMNHRVRHPDGLSGLGQLKPGYDVDFIRLKVDCAGMLE